MNFAKKSAIVAMGAAAMMISAPAMATGGSGNGGHEPTASDYYASTSLLNLDNLLNGILGGDLSDYEIVPVNVWDVLNENSLLDNLYVDAHDLIDDLDVDVLSPDVLNDISILEEVNIGDINILSGNANHQTKQIFWWYNTCDSCSE